MDDVGEFGELIVDVLVCAAVCEEFMAEGGVCCCPGVDVFLAVLVDAVGPDFLPEFGGEGEAGEVMGWCVGEVVSLRLRWFGLGVEWDR